MPAGGKGSLAINTISGQRDAYFCHAMSVRMSPFKRHQQTQKGYLQGVSHRTNSSDQQQRFVSIGGQ